MDTESMLCSIQVLIQGNKVGEKSIKKMLLSSIMMSTDTEMEKQSSRHETGANQTLQVTTYHQAVTLKGRLLDV